VSGRPVPPVPPTNPNPNTTPSPDRLLDRYQDDLFHLFHLLSVVKLAVILLYLGHIFGCFFYFFSGKEVRERASFFFWNNHLPSNSGRLGGGKGVHPADVEFVTFRLTA
jgi:hypothetical protein